MTRDYFSVARVCKSMCTISFIFLFGAYIFIRFTTEVNAIFLDTSYENGTGYQIGINWCQGGPGDFRTYCRRNCTSYVACRLASSGVSMDHYQNNGNGKDWANNARAKGIVTGMEPKVGAVAYWASGGGGYGHVAYVESVNADGSVNTSNYNGLTEEFYTQTNVWPESYIYFSNVGKNNKDGTLDLFAVNRKDAGSGKTSFHVVNGANPSQFLKHTATVLQQTDANWDFDFEDFNKDGTLDLFAVNRKDAGSGKTSFHVVNGANPSQFLKHTATVLQQTDANWDFDFEDFNKDGTLDLFAVNRKDAGSGKTSFHVVNGANPGQFLFHGATALHQTDGNWSFELDDYNKDGVLDLFAISRRDVGSGKTAFHVINGANPGQFLKQTATVLQQTDANWDFDFEDFNKDGTLDLFAVNRKDAGSGKTSFHVVNGANPSQFLKHTATVLQQTDANWDFDIEDF